MKPEKPTSLAPDGKDLEAREVAFGTSQVPGCSNARKEDGGVSTLPSVASTNRAFVYRPLPLQTYRLFEGRENGAAKKARLVGRFVGHAAASTLLSELFRAARRRSVRGD